MKGTANVPAGGKKVTPENIGAQAKLTGTEDQYVGFNDKGEAVAKSPLTGKETQYVGFDKTGKQVAKDFPEATKPVTGTEGQYIGFDAEGKQVAKDPLTGTESQYVGFDKDGNPVVKDFPEAEETSSKTAFFGTIGTEWTEDEETGVKSQMVAIEGVQASHTLGVLDVVMTHERTSEGYAAFVEETNQFLAYITNGDAETVDGGVMFYIYGDPNTISIPFALEVC